MMPGELLATKNHSNRQHLDLSHEDAVWALNQADSRRRVLLVALNMPGYYSLAVRLLALVVAQDSSLAAQVDIRYVEADNNADLVKLAERLADWRPDLIAWTVNIWNRLPVQDLLRRLRPSLPQTLFLFGGQEVTGSAVDFLNLLPELDYIIEGEGELAFAQFVQSWLQAGGRELADPAMVSGLRFRRQGQPELTRPADLVQDLDSLPSVILAGLVQPDQRNLLGVMLEGSRGCPNRCSFCFEGGRSGRVRSASVARLAEEAAFMAGQGAGYFHILDPILCNSNPARLRELTAVLTELQERNPRTVISVEIYAHQVSEELAACLQSCTIVDVGLQSTHEPTARAIHRAWQPQRFQAGLARLRRAQVPFNIYLICGLPEETLATYLQGLSAIMAGQPTRIFCNELCLLNGTELRHRALEYGYHFDRNPPYRAWSNRWMSAADFRLAQAASKVVEKYYNLTSRAIYTKAPWLPGHAPEYGGTSRISLTSPCSRQCPGCVRAQAVTTNMPPDLVQALTELEDDDVEIFAGDLVDREALVQLMGRLQLHAPARLRLVGPPELFDDADWVQWLVQRGVWHFRSFAEAGEARQPDLTALSQTCRLTGFAVVRPFSDIVLLLPQEPDADADAQTCVAALKNLADQGLTMVTVPAGVTDMPASWQQEVALQLEPLVEQLSWLRLPETTLKMGLEPYLSGRGEELGQICRSLQILGLSSSAVNQPPCYLPEDAAPISRNAARHPHIPVL